MATEPATAPVNGAYGSQQPYTTTGQQPLSSHPPNTSSGPTASNGAGNSHGTAAGANPNSGNGDANGVSKDEVGWYFVEQYYTTLSRSPEKLHLFYSKRSQFVSGVEAEKVSVSVGQRAINERIKELDIQDCKVRVSNVDSQESFKNIVVQVIGEMSNKAAPHRKFVQTFVLAEQPNGYFVLNDIFRYIAEEEEEEPEHEVVPELDSHAVSAPEEEHKTLTSSDDPAVQEQDAELVDKKLEESVAASGSEELTSNKVAANGDATTESDQKEETAPHAAAESADASETVKEEEAQPAANEDLDSDAPKEPVPTPVAPSPKPAKAAPAKAPAPAAMPKPAAPKTWASMVAANRVGSPATQSATSSTSSAPAQPKAAPPPAVSTVAANTAVNDDSAAQVQQSPGSEWQTAGQDNGKRQSRQQPGSAPNGATDKTNVLGYVKNVTERVDAALLKTTLAQYGKLAYFDVSRPKNCAFVEFADAAGYNAAVAANPHSIGGELIYVEERRPRATAYGGGFNNRGGMRGGREGQGRGNFPTKDGGRGGFPPRGGARGGAMTPRGRGMPQAA